MARTVSVILQAEVAQYVSGMTKAALATKGVGDSAEASSAKANKHFDLAGKGALLMGTAVAGALVGIVAKSMDFEKSMSAVQAATGASVATLGDLRAAAMKAGADTQYSATEAADGITEMAKAGVSAKDIMGGGLKGALSLAAAGQLDVASAAGIASTAMTQFSLSGKDLPHVADLLAAGAGKAMGSVDDLGQALNQAGLLASSTGISIEETTGTLAAFASAGLIGSDAGTSFKTMLQQLQAPSKQAQGLMDGLGISAYDAQGKFVGLSGLAQQLKSHLGGLTQAQRDNALATIFGTDAARAATVLYREGASGIEEWTRKVNDAGYAQKQAAALTDNLSGDLERLGGSFDTLMISIGSGAQGPLRTLVQMFGGVVDGATGVVKVFGELPGPVQSGIAAMAAWGIAGDKIMAGFGGIRDKISAFREEAALQQALFAQQSQSMSDAERALGGLGNSLDVTGGKFGTARAAVGAFAKAIGPELGVGLAIAVIGSLISSIETLAHAGDSARTEVSDLNRSLGDIDSNDARIAATADAIKDLSHKLADAKANAADTGALYSSAFNPVGLGEAVAKYKDASSSVDVYRKAIADLEGQQRRTEAATDALSQKYGITTSSVLELADKYRIDLSQGLSNVQAQFVSSGAAAEIATGAVTSVGNAAGMTKAQIEAASKAQEDWLTSLQKIATGFVDPLNTYKTLLSDKQTAEQASAQATADSTESSKDSWKDYVQDVTVSLGEYATKLEDEIKAQENWRANIATITARGGIEVGQILAGMGVEGAQITAQMATATAADFERMKNDLITQAQLAGSGAASAMDTQMKVLAAAAEAGGRLSVQGLASQLGLGVGVVAGIVAQYNSTLAGGINPILMSLGKPTIAGYHVAGINGPGGTQTKASGGYISGPGSGTSDSIPARLSNGEFVVRASQTAKHLDLLHAINSGMPGYATGGFVSASSVPRPRSTAPYGVPISTAGDATMSKGYDETTAFLNAQMAAMGGGGPVGASVQRWLPLVVAALNLMHQPASLAQTTLRRMQQESGGNPRAINLTDINAKRGDPSKGLMQVIGSTFRAYAMPGHNSDVYDPLSNILASMNYAIHRYGSLSAAYNKAGGYANGGTTPAGDPFWVGENGPELMWSSKSKYVSSAQQSREISGGGGGGGSSFGPANVTVQARVFVGSREITDIARVEAEAVVVGALTGAADRGGFNR